MNNYLNFKIVGTGPSGLLLAISLAKLNFNIYTTDLLTREKLINKDKTYAITHSTRKILSKFNLWSKLKSYLYKFDSLSISDSVTSDFTILTTSDLDKDIVIDNYNFEYSSDEIKILKKLSEWPKCIDISSTKLEPHRIPVYLYELASEFHSYWNLGKQFPEKRFINDQKNISPDKLIFLKAIANVVKSGMDIVGVDSPTKM